MNFAEYTKSILRGARRLVDQARDVLPHWRIVTRKPATIWSVVSTAYRAQITLVILLVFMVFLAPVIVDFLTGWIFPPQTSKKVLGLIKTQETNPLQSISYAVLMSLSWVISVAAALRLFWLHIPAGLARANTRAQELLALAEGSSDLSQKLALYRRAFAIATDPQLEAELGSRIDRVNNPSIANLANGQTEVSLEEFNLDVMDSDSEPVFKQNDLPSVSGLSSRYELREKIGSGAMGVVFSAWDKVLDRKVAIKQLSMILSGDNEYILRFHREAKALARLNHPNVVQVYDLIESDDRLWMVVEYVDGGDLASYLKDNGRLPINQAVNLIVPIAEGLSLAHGQGIVHRDLKPANILLTSALVPKITDFGIAKLSQSSDLTQTGSVLGSPPYMSPEQCSGGAVDSRTDIYALGITLYELLTGTKPFDGDTSSVLARQIVEPPAPLSDHCEDIPRELNESVLKMLAKNPDDRPPDLNMVVELLSIFKDAVPSLGQPQAGSRR